MVRSTIHRWGTKFEADRRIRSFDNFKVDMRKRFRERVGELRALIAAVGEELLQEGKQPKQRRHHQNAAVAILDVGWMNNRWSRRPNLSTRICRFLPLIFLPAS